MDFTKAKTSTIFLRYVIPQMVGLIANSVYFIVDGVFIGRRLGAGALAAAGVAVPVVEITIAASMLISVGAGILISAAAGRGDGPGARNVFAQAVACALALSAALAVLGNIFLEPLSFALGANEAILADTMTYLRYFISFSPFLIFSFLLSTLARNDGRPGLAMVALTIGSASNILLDWVFMYPMDMGIAGAALATGLGPVFSVALLLPHFLKKRGTLWFTRPRGGLRPVGRLLAGGAPAFIAEFSIGLVTLLYNLAIVRAGLGEDGLAAYLVIGYAALICLTAFLGAAQGMQPAVSYLVGAGQAGRVRSLFGAAALFCLGLSAALYAALFFGGGAFFSIFLAGDGALLAYTAGAARLYFVMLPFAALNILLISFMQSMGRAAPSLAVSLARSTLPVMACLLVLPLLWPHVGLWLALAVAEAATLGLGVLLWARLWRGKTPLALGRTA